MKGFIQVPAQHASVAANSDIFKPTLVAISAINLVGNYGPEKSRIVLKTLSTQHNNVINDILIVNMVYNELVDMLDRQVQSDTIADQTKYQFNG